MAARRRLSWGVGGAAQLAVSTLCLLLLLPEVMTSGIGRREIALDSIWKRANSPTDVCVRWSHQTAVVNNTIYVYGGQAKMETNQKIDTWNNNFLTLSLAEDWDRTDPKLTGLPQPDGPPPVANGYLWHDYDTIYLYGGLFSDVEPVTEPTEFALWAYDIKGKKWSDVTAETSVSPDSGSKQIQRAAEGAGISVPGRNLGFYFGGHLDGYTTKGWSQSVPRVYLKSLLEFDMEKKEFRNVTGSGLEKAGVPERADGVLVFVPWGEEGILVTIGGGTNETFSQMNVIDVYDLGTKKWTKQPTDGPTPKYRVNPCAVVASAADGSSHNIYFFGGQNLVPYMEQHQYDDMWILTIPAFTWVKVDASDQSVPPARAGHTCDIVGSQMVVIGGFVGTELSCDSPGFYIFDVSKLEWVNAYSSAAGGFDKEGNPLTDTGGLQVGGAYKVPQVVVDIVGGDGDGNAKVTAPVRKPDPDSPLVTGAARDYKYLSYPKIAITTNADGSITTSTSGPEGGDDGGDGGPNIGAIVGGVVGGISFVVILLFGGAYLLYRRKIAELRASAAMVAQSSTPGSGEVDGAHPESAPLKESGVGGLGMMGATGSTQDLNMMEGEPTFWGVLLSPRRSLRVVNH